MIKIMIIVVGLFLLSGCEADRKSLELHYKVQDIIINECVKKGGIPIIDIPNFGSRDFIIDCKIK